MISVTATTLRDGQPQELPIAQLVPGDVVKLAAGDMIPADVRIVAAKDLFLIQGSLTGESFPVEKFEVDEGPPERSPIELANLAFLGTSVGARLLGARLLHRLPRLGNVMVHVDLYGQGGEHHHRVGPSHNLPLHSHE